MKKTSYIAGLICCLTLSVFKVNATELYFVDAHSQFDEDVEADLIIRRMDEGGVYKTILASRRQRKAREAGEVAEQYPDRIVPSLRTKSRHYKNDTHKYYKKIRKAVNSGRFRAMAELLVFHAEKPGKADEVVVSLSDNRILTALELVKSEGWPLVIHIEFASLKGQARQKQMDELNTFLQENDSHPIALIHMGQLPENDVEALINKHKNIYFMTSHADPVSAIGAKQPWINMMDGEVFKPKWKKIIEKYPTRFVFAIDNVWAFQWQDTYMKHIKVWRSALAKLPDNIAHSVAHKNAERLWNLSPK